MNQWIFPLLTAASLLSSGVPGFGADNKSDKPKSDKPNILWIVAEDLGCDLACYGVKGAYTPNLDMLAKEGALYTHAYTTAAICAPSRSGFMTGLYPQQVNSKYMRPGPPFVKKPLPEGIHVFTKYIRDAGYTIGLCGRPKKDWGFETPRINPYDETDWEVVSAKQPFFCQYQYYETHPPFHPCPEHPVDTTKIELPPNTPDTPEARKEFVLYLEYLNALDMKIGDLIKDLKSKGLYEKTIIFFIGDNGPALFRGKCFVHERGIQMPLIVRMPEKYNAGIKPGTVNEELVSALDLAPTFIDLAGGRMPNYLEGRILFGPNKQKEPDFLYALWDNLDIVTDRVRCVFSKKWKYIRNFAPEISYYEQGHRNVEAVRAAKELYDKGELPQQFGYYFKPKPPEELYDLENDPFELTNLVNDVSRKVDLEKMQNALARWIKRTNDSDKPEDPKLIKEMIRLRAEDQKEKASKRGKKNRTQQND